MPARQAVRRAGAFAITLVLAAGLAVPARATGGYVITQREGKSVSRLTLAPAGLRFDSFSAARKGAAAKLDVSLLIRYRDRHVFLLDPGRRVYDSVSLAATLSTYAAELKASANGQPSERLPVKPGTKRRTGQAPLKLPAATLRRLKLTATIHGVRVRAYLLQSGALRQRLWYSATLPRPPADVRALLAKSGTSSGSASIHRVTSSQNGRIPLRIDEPRGKRWRTVLRTTSIKRRAIAASSLQPPRSYKERALLDTTPAKKRAKGATVPADPIRCGIIVACGPISSHPDLWAFYWGTKFKGRTDVVSSINHALENFVGDEFADPFSKNFWGPLDQYGVGRGRFLGYDIVNENPDDSVGSWNFFDIDAFIITHRFGSDAPNYWWRWSDHDPIMAIFVDSAQVDSGGWGGYHFFTPTEGLLLAAAAHVNMPWFIVKVPSVASIPLDRGSAGYRNALDTTTERASHEFVEAATDPYPFTSWADPLKEPIWEKGEIGDICEASVGSVAPFATNTRVLKNSTAFSTFWSNDDNACMPESRPALTLDSPASGSSFSWGGQVTLIATADDLFDGKVDDTQYRWTSDRDGALGIGRILNKTTLSPGTHRISVQVTNSQGGTRTAGPITISVVVQPPTVRLDGPSDGSSFAADQKINLRGSAFDGKDGDIGPSATWSVDGTAVGTGASLLQHQISVQGAHTITLSATNSGGITRTAQTHVTIGPPTGKPNVLITSPPLAPDATDRYFGPGEVLTFSATADAQGVATIADSGYVWTDSVDGFLGTGPTIQHTLTSAATIHDITVTVTDSLGRTGTDKIRETFFFVP